MQTTLVTFSLTLMLKVRVPDIQMWKAPGYPKTSEQCRNVRKIKMHMCTV